MLEAAGRLQRCLHRVVKAASPGAHVTIGRASGIMVSGRTALGGGPRTAQLRTCSDVIDDGVCTNPPILGLASENVHLEIEAEAVLRREQ